MLADKQAFSKQKSGSGATRSNHITLPQHMVSPPMRTVRLTGNEEPPSSTRSSIPVTAFYRVGVSLICDIMPMQHKFVRHSLTDVQ